MDTRLAEELWDQIPDAILATTADDRVVYWNCAAEAIFGYPRAEALDRTVGRLIIPADRIEEERRIQADLAAHDLAVYESVRRRKDGSLVDVSVTSKALRDADGTVRLVLSVQKDVTRLKVLRDPRSEHERALHEANRLRGEFLANMSHELRTPLNGIIGFSEFLIDEKPGPLNAKQKEYLGDVLNSGRHLLQLINDVLDLSRVEAGKMELRPETFAVDRAVEDVCAVLSPLIRQKNITIRRDIDVRLGDVTLDRHKFMQVLYNLLSNGAKFNDDGGEIRIVAEAEASGGLCLRVRDTGIGIKPEDFPKLFIEFQQLDSSAARRCGGRGLGLALTKKIVEFQGGRISVDSASGRGSTFTVFLPLPAAADLRAC